MTDPDTDTLAIRRAGPDDLAAATTLVEHAWTATNAEFLPSTTITLLTAENSIAGLIASRSQELWLAEHVGDLAAVLGVDSNGYVWACYVHPDHQRKGIGRALMNAVKAYFEDKDVACLHLDLIDGNTAAQTFYLAQGWVEESRRPEPLPGHMATAIRLVYAL
ncbi:MAG: GNAT family N-acetyltransferase [Alphaproteobacteria bacterium]|nr:GNAT family N-acetyltransferase [Alphaproteobacteria bacterium]